MTKCDWKDCGDKAFYRKIQSVRLRREVIKDKYPDFRCPSCKEIIIEPRRWVIRIYKSHIDCICKSCFQRFKAIPVPLEIEKVYSVDEVFLLIPRFKVRGNILSVIREKAGVSKAEFARRCGWSRSYQTKLENGEYNSMSEETKRIIVEELKKLKLVTE